MEDTRDILNDYEHSVTNKIRDYGEEPDFPRLEDFGVSREELSGYLFDKQAIIDSRGSEKSRYTIYGILMVIPILVQAAFPDEKLPFGELTILLSIGIGLLLALLYRVVMEAVIKLKLRRLNDERIEQYIAKVLAY